MDEVRQAGTVLSKRKKLLRRKVNEIWCCCQIVIESNFESLDLVTTDYLFREGVVNVNNSIEEKML